MLVLFLLRETHKSQLLRKRSQPTAQAANALLLPKLRLAAASPAVLVTTVPGLLSTLGKRTFMQATSVGEAAGSLTQARYRKLVMYIVHGFMLNLVWMESVVVWGAVVCIRRRPANIG